MFHWTQQQLLCRYQNAFLLVTANKMTLIGFESAIFAKMRVLLPKRLTLWKVVDAKQITVQLLLCAFSFHFKGFIYPFFPFPRIQSFYLTVMQLIFWSKWEWMPMKFLKFAKQHAVQLFPSSSFRSFLPNLFRRNCYHKKCFIPRIFSQSKSQVNWELNYASITLTGGNKKPLKEQWFFGILKMTSQHSPSSENIFFPSLK